MYQLIDERVVFWVYIVFEKEAERVTRDGNEFTGLPITDEMHPGHRQFDGMLTSMEQFTSEGCMSLEEDITDFPCWGLAVLDYVLGEGPSEFNIQGHVFAGKVGGMPFVELRLDQDPSVRNEAITRRYFEQLSGLPTDWMEIDPPANLYKLADLLP